MTGSAKQSSCLEKELDCFVANARRNDGIVPENKTGRGAIHGRLVQ
jgi:hypothetical protein